MTTTTRTLEVSDLYRITREPWGGATVNMRTGEAVPDGSDLYAAAITTTISIPETADLDAFSGAYAAAREDFSGAPYLGVFHDDARHTVEFDGVVVTDRAGIDALYAAGYPVEGGAYHFSDGQGYWPQGRPEEYAEVTT